MSDPARAVLCNFDLSTPGKGDVAWPTSTIEYPGKVASLTSFEAPSTGIVYGFEGATDVGIGMGGGVAIYLGGPSPVFNFGAGALEITAGASITMDTGTITAGNGDVTLPAFACIGSPQTGIYRAGANQLGISCNAVNVATFKSTGLELATVLAGAYGGTGVANTGKTITVSGNTTIGSSTHTVALSTTGNTSVTLPTSGTLAKAGANTDITSLGGVLDIGAGGAVPTASIYPVVVATKSGNQTLTAGSTTDVLSFDTEVFDSANAWNTGTNTFTVPSNAAGKYEIGVQGFRLNDNGAGTDAIIRIEIYVNGSAHTILFQENVHTTDVSYGFCMSAIIGLAVSDAVTIRATQFTGTAWTAFTGSGVRIHRLHLA